MFDQALLSLRPQPLGPEILGSAQAIFQVLTIVAINVMMVIVVIVVLFGGVAIGIMPLGLHINFTFHGRVFCQRETFVHHSAEHHRRVLVFWLALATIFLRQEWSVPEFSVQATMSFYYY